MANDDWRLHITLGDAAEHGDLLERFRRGFGSEASELAEALSADRLVVSNDNDELFVYAATREQARRAHEIVETELRALDIQGRVSPVEHWLTAEERWDSEPADETWEEQEIESGYAPWEVRISCHSRAEAQALASQLEDTGYFPIRRWRHLIVGTATREEAVEMAERLHGQAETSGEVVWEAATDAGVVRPFTFFG